MKSPPMVNLDLIAKPNPIDMSEIGEPEPIKWADAMEWAERNVRLTGRPGDDLRAINAARDRNGLPRYKIIDLHAAIRAAREYRG